MSVSPTRDDLTRRRPYLPIMRMLAVVRTVSVVGAIFIVAVKDPGSFFFRTDSGSDVFGFVKNS